MALYRSTSFHVYLILVTFSFLKTAATLEYGAECDRTASRSVMLSDFCNSELNLYCNGKTCVCSMGGVYDKQLRRCVPRVGGICQPSEKCPTGAGCEPVFNISPGVTPPESILKMLLKIKTFNVYYTCVCNAGFGSDKDRENCIPFLQHGDTCSLALSNRKLDCAHFLGLECIAGRCSCSDTSMIYDHSFNRCVTKVGRHCDRYHQCEQNSMCSLWFDEVKRLIKTKKMDNMRSYSQQSTCECVPGYSQNSEGRCVGSYHASCSATSHCNKDRFLACVDGICQCEAGSIELFSEGKAATRCHLLPGSACSIKKGPQCWQNYICKNGRCDCGDEYTKSPAGFCLINHGGKCDGSEWCNYLQGLACIESKCTCFDSTLNWNPKMSMCTAEEGGICGKFNETQTVEAESANRTDLLFPDETAAHVPPFYVVACANGLDCSSDDAHGSRHCRK